MTAPYAILHFLVDGLCAFAMFGTFSVRENWYLNVLLYNFCAFALQMPMGVVLDTLNRRKCERKYEPSFGFAAVGVMLTCLGAVTHPVILGFGNALFHLGGGVGTIHEDEAKGWKGRGLGVFVAPGALGLYLGTLLAKGEVIRMLPVLIVIGLVAVCCLGWCCYLMLSQKKMTATMAEANIEKDGLLLLLGCLLVVILRSYIGMAVGFSWKTTVLAGTIAVLAVVFGKVAGGFVAAGAGIRRTVVVSLLFAAVCYMLSENMLAGILALFLFNMTMPITLYLLVQKLKGLAGFSFGLLTFGLFIGFLPTYLGMELLVDDRVLGAVGSLLSLVILWLCVKRYHKGV
ncbi:MAG: hypothetical protein J6L65_08650 [Lachnospiraceae bacterium]|nr:hypothetical protein [Lachnospiraceae bacterium]